MTTAATKHRSHSSNGLMEDVHRVGEGVGKIKDEVSETAHHVAVAAKSGIEAAKSGLKGSMSAARDYGRAAADGVGNQIKARPFTSLAIAAGVGFAAAMLMRRRG